jgi:hypothetical protein
MGGRRDRRALVDYATLIGGMTLAEEILERARKRLHR